MTGKLTSKGRQTRQRIVAAAAGLMFEGGVARTTMEDVRAAAGVSSSQIYHYFTDKEALVRAVIEFQNENLMIEIDGAVAVIVPDLITIVDFDTARAIPTEALRYGQRVAVIACSAPPQLSTPAALAVMGPAAFGLPHPYQPFE